LDWGLYLRISKIAKDAEPAADSGDRETSIERQNDRLCELAEDYEGNVVGYWRDPDRSAYKRKVFRRDFHRFVDAARRGEFQVMGVAAVDRFTRQGREIEAVIDMVIETRLERLWMVTDTDEVYDLTDEQDQQRLRERTVQAQAESARTSRRVKRTTRKHAENGRPHPGGRRPYGHEWRRENRKVAWLVVVEPEATVIREAARRVVNGETMRSIATSLNDRDIPTAMGKRWSGASLRSVLDKPRLAGYRERDGVLYTANGDGVGGIEPILTPTEWEQLSATLRNPAHTRREVRTAKHLLTGLMRCGVCGGRMSAGYAQGGRRTYQCSGKSGAAAKACVNVSADRIEPLIEQAWVEAFDGPEAAETATAAAAAREQVDHEAVEAEITELLRRIKVAQHDCYVTNELTKAEFSDIRRELTAMVDELRRSIRRDARAERIAEVKGNAQAEWDDSTLEERRVLLSLVIDHITIDRRTRAAGTFDPSRVSITLRS
jgi:DNA invertase Pin-like site-specific DNA recombinase